MIAAVLAQAVEIDPLTADDTLVAQNIAFGVIAAVMLYSAFRMVTTRNVVHAALYLVIVLAGTAAQFLLAGAEFIAATQILVYIGAIVVLFLFGIMLTRGSLGVEELERNERRGMAALVAVLLAVVTGYALIDGFENTRFEVASPSTTAQVSDSIFSQYIVPFEAASVLLLAALIGAIVIARKD